MSHDPNRPAEGRRPSPHTQAGDAIPDDPRLLQAAHEYLGELEAGRRPDRRAWLQRYPDLADALNQCLDGLELVHQAAPLASPLSGDLSRLAGGAADPLAAAPLGDFRIVREIGRGGMGIVYEAVQLSLARRVALKVLPFAATFDAKHLQRFRQEAQAAAGLHHTNIVPVYAVGCERGIHFYAMQLIDGQPLDVVVRQLRGQAGMGPPEGGSADGPTAAFGLSGVQRSGADQAAVTQSRSSAHFSTYRPGKEPELYRAVARAMAQAAEALEYAHQQGIVHRDIKPANLLIDARGNVWITDFGLAHFHDAPALTRTGDVLGTMRYMSPEQASGQRVILDHRTDIYSLGATFYELLTLEPIFSGRTRQALLADVLSREPRPPRAIDRRIPAELEIIVRKALSKSPADRYATAQELADDLQRFLRDEPIRARRPSLLEQGRKWSRRHPAVLAAAALVMFLICVVSLTSNYLIGRANERAKAALAESRLRAEEAERRFQQARAAADLLIEVSEKDLADTPPAQGLRKRLLETALGYYRDFVAQQGGNPARGAELRAVQERLKKVLDDLTVLEGAGQLIMLADRRVQDDLALDDAQRGKIEDLTRDFAQRRLDSLGDFREMSSPDRRSRFLALARANDRVMRATLSAGQLQRLEQVTLQLHGPMVFDQAEIVARLHLSDAQRQAIRQIQREVFATAWNLGEGPDGPPPPPGGRQAMLQGVMEKALAVLTPAQLSEWRELSGPAFRGALDFPPPGFPPDGPPPGGPRPPGPPPDRPPYRPPPGGPP
jgi:hypothetical protein